MEDKRQREIEILNNKLQADETKEFYLMLIGIKEQLARQDTKIDNLINLQSDINKARQIAVKADYRSLQNLKEIEKLRIIVSNKADKESLVDLRKQRAKDITSIPSWIAIIISGVSVIFVVLNYVMN